MSNRTFYAGKFAAQEARKADEAREAASGHTAWKRREAAQAAVTVTIDAEVARLGLLAIEKINAGETRTGDGRGGVVPVHSSPAPNAAAVRLGTNRGCDRTVAAPYPLVMLCRAAGLCEPVPEYQFHPRRKWRADYAWPLQMVLIEIDGGVFTQGRHTRGAGFIADQRKTNAAALLGYRVLRYTPDRLTEAIDDLRIALA